jgi:hypothetical protein
VVYDKVIIENGHEKNMCYDEIGLCMQHILTILGTIVNPIGEGIVAYELISPPSM